MKKYIIFFLIVMSVSIALDLFDKAEIDVYFFIYKLVVSAVATFIFYMFQRKK